MGTTVDPQSNDKIKELMFLKQQENLDFIRCECYENHPDEIFSNFLNEDGDNIERILCNIDNKNCKCIRAFEYKEDEFGEGRQLFSESYWGPGSERSFPEQIMDLPEIWECSSKCCCDVQKCMNVLQFKDEVSRNKMTKNVCIRMTEKKGYGLFTNEKGSDGIKKGEYIGAYHGVMFTEDSPLLNKLNSRHNKKFSD